MRALEFRTDCADEKPGSTEISLSCSSVSRYGDCSSPTRNAVMFAYSVKLAGELGFEPRQTESESVVLPLHHSPPKQLILQHFLRKFSKIAKEFSKSGVWQR